ncbi:hypothetical protein Psal006b_03610 (plasmid) [Piscirickettsia salmonis]|uniref:Uncharacterized protein n=1 Tax=Piscirickettsia salmonis TaxID=1238 RepID=A0A6I5Y3L9_PISSA|nr:DUF3168 domain-containing protein [Piscirickettsia salmonis]AKP75036.2 hypothetical protein PSLF89_3p9 [Piscirickettsia salmonis LF-89 = ATCC VR-1361]ALB24437.1 hypothetical protein KU39_2p34 [Piscirickettsia salmonis]ALY04620.1 hypothetical protein AWE47_17070 [Piscirickettsia salmonis]AOS37009.1 hypothetical protein AVM72_16700 [Piscirickettsia salmonis]APS65519.1 hypothetical protein AVI54_17110 [Piscirickettsia salmonis]
MIEDIYFALLGTGWPVFPMVLPKNQILPAVTYQVIGGDRRYSLDAQAHLQKKTIQISCIAKTYQECKLMQDNITEQLNGYHNENIQLITFESELDQYEQDTKTYRTNLTFHLTGVV